ncbi:MAG: AMP-binding protein [Candidatus Eremiobacteraeota bacterium]|nr:AMP-binding protein [Candidatus Eremiobacteraeota bacterium]
MEPERLVLETVRQLADEIGVGRGRPTLSSHLESELGIGSLERVELLARLEKASGRKLAEEGIFQSECVLDLVALFTTPAGQPPGRQGLQLGLAPGPPARADDLISLLLSQAERLGNRPRAFFLEGGRVEQQLAPAGLLERARCLATGLHLRGVGPGDRVAMMLASGPDFYVAFFGILWAAGVPVPLDPPMRPEQVEDYVARQGAILADAGARVLVVMPELARLAEVLRPRARLLEHLVTVAQLEHEAPARERAADSGEGALICYTSGSNGSPKGVLLSHANILANIRAIAGVLELGPQDVVVSWLPLQHDLGLIGKLLTSFYWGLPLVLMAPEHFLARPARWLRAISDFGGTISAAPNFAYEMCLRKLSDREVNQLDLSSWRVAINGAEPVRAQTVEAFNRRFASCGFEPKAVCPAYGLAEASLAVSLARGLKTHQGLVSCGRPLQGVEVKVEQGRVLVKGPSLIRGYGHPPLEGWLDTGDLGFWHEGELYPAGRAKDLIVTAGRNLYPQDVERLLDEVAGLRPGCSAALGLEGQLVVVGEARPGQDLQALRAAIAQALTRGLGVSPDRIELVPPRTVPRTPGGKVRRGETRRRLLDGSLGHQEVWWWQISRVLLSSSGFWLRRGLAHGGRRLRAVRMLTNLGICALPILATLALRPASTPTVLARAGRLFFGLCGLVLKTDGDPPADGPLMVVANHASLLDPLVMLSLWTGPPLCCVIARSVAKNPVIQYFLSHTRHIVVRRGGDGASLAVEAMQQALQEGLCVLVFPEGGVEAAAGVRTFATGAFRAAAAAGAPVLPVALKGTRRALAPGSLALVAGTTITAEYGPLLRPHDSGWEGAVELARQSRQWIATRVGEPLVDRRMARHD